MLNNSGFLLTNISFAIFLGLNLFKNVAYSKNVKQVENLYQDFIIKYNQLNKVFDLNDPIEIYTMYYYLLCGGYLSVGKNFEFSYEETQIDLLGAEVMRGKACCQHISALLVDILNNYGIESGQLVLYSTYAHVKVLEQSKDIIERIIGNHAITFAIKDGKSYYLDPTNNKIYRMSENGKNLICTDECIITLIKHFSTILLNGFKDYLKIKKRLSENLISVTLEKETEMVSQTIRKCENNIDIFEKFYNENNDLYCDISSKILKLNK